MSGRRKTLRPMSLRKLAIPDTAESEAEKASLKKLLLDKKQELSYLEAQASKVNEVRILLQHLMQDFQETRQLTFVQNVNELENPKVDIQDCVALVRGGIDNLINYHEKLAARYELELSKNMFELGQQLERKQEELAKERELLRDEERRTVHKRNLIKAVDSDKFAIIKTIRMRRAALERHMEASAARQSKFEHSIAEAEDEYRNAVHTMELADNDEKLTIRKQDDRNTKEQTQMRTHNEIVDTVTRLRKDLNREAYLHNETAAALDRAKRELTQLCRVIDSYHDNLKSQILLDAEEENRRLRAVLSIENHDFNERLEKHRKTGSDLFQDIKGIKARIDRINQDIASTEQKIQAQMMRIPDFPQLHAALDRVMEQSRKYKEFVAKRKYLLDEVRERNRLLDEAEIQDSKDRMRQLSIVMPLEHEKREQEQKARLARLLKENLERSKAIDDALDISTGFSHAPYATSI